MGSTIKAEEELQNTFSATGSVVGVTKADEAEAKSTKANSGSIETPYSWFMLLVAFLAILHIQTASLGSPVYYVLYVEYFGISKATGAWVFSLFPLSCFSIGFVSGPLTSQYGCRITTVIGGMIMSMSLLVASFSNHISMILAFQGVIAGCGGGIVFLSSNVILTKYFDKHQSVASGLANCSFGVALLAAPALVSYLSSQYGWKGSLLIQSAISLHLVPLGLLMGDPVRKAPESRVIPLNIGDGIVESEKKASKPTFTNILNLSILGHPYFALFCISNFVVKMLSNMYISHLPTFLVTEGFSLSQAASVTTVSGACSSVMTFLASLMAVNSRLNHSLVYGLVKMLASPAILMLLLLEGYKGKLAAAVLFGSTLGFEFVFVPTILVQLEGAANLAKSLAIYNLFVMAPTITGMAPITGALYDITGSYDLAFYLGCGLNAAGAILSFLLAHLLKKKSSGVADSALAAVDIETNIWSIETEGKDIGFDVHKGGDQGVDNSDIYSTHV